MIITLSPARSDDTLTVVRRGGTLIVNGTPADLAAYDAAHPHPAIVGQPEQRDGTWHVTLLLPYGPAPEWATAADRAAVEFPAPIVLTQDGPVTLPHWPEAPEEH